MTSEKLAVIVLAAGLGTRMRSARPKVLHPVAGRAMLHHVLDAVATLSPERVVVVTGPGMEAVAAAAAPLRCVVQEEPLGTGHAVASAKLELDGYHGPEGAGNVLVVFGDTPLLTPDTLEAMLERRRRPDAPDLVGLAFRPADPGHYGRVFLDAEGRVRDIVEYADASEAERRIDFCNAGVLLGGGPALFGLVDRIGRDNAKNEYYLTDVFALAKADGRRAVMAEANPEEVLGVNSRAELAVAEAVMQTRLRARAMAGGATLIDPTTVWLCADTRLGQDVTLHPNVVFGPGVSVEDNVEIRSFCHIEGARIASGAVIGPFARLRPGADLGADARVGNFVEIKNATLGQGAKANHLTYLGDAEVGAGANIGAGTITCNYDGIAKHRTEIGPGAFIGSNTALVAPVKVGEGAIVGAGSTITRDVADEAIAVTRGEETQKEGAAKRFRERRKAAKRSGKESEKAGE